MELLKNTTQKLQSVIQDARSQSNDVHWLVHDV